VVVVVDEEQSLSDNEWLARQFESLTSELQLLTPSQWAEKHRYLQAGSSPLPGGYRFKVTPYLKEIVDCLSPDSPVRELAFMKGTQIGATSGVLENGLAYWIAHVSTAPMMFVTADAEMAKARLTGSIIPMLQVSGLAHLLRSADEGNKRKSGKTDEKLEWEGGGCLVPFGAKSPNKMRMFPIRVMLRDEVDGWPLVVGKDGDPIKLTASRTDAYHETRKILDISTPTIKGLSKIAHRFALGDQRRYFVCCLKCGFPQWLRWKRDADDGSISGIWWDTEGGKLIPDSVRYLCSNCQHGHTNDDKTRLFDPSHGAEWRPTANPSAPWFRSYHLSALYSPVGMQSWGACVEKWFEAWDVERNRVRDPAVLQVFYNNVLGDVFEVRGEKLRFENVSPHRRTSWDGYVFGTIPNKHTVEHCGSPVLVLTCAVDVHKSNLAVAVFGWCRDRRAVLISYDRFVGDSENLDDPGTWGALRELMNKDFVADDGKRYRIALTLIDSGYRADDVYQFCTSADGCYPIKGQEESPKSAKFREFSQFKTPLGTLAYGVTVNHYKDRWSALLRRGWSGQGMQPEGYFNAPMDVEDDQLKELTVETKREKVDKLTGKRLGIEWHRPSGANNELWDLLIYNNAALELLAWDLFFNLSGRDAVVWPEFYDDLAAGRFFEVPTP
jgi:phage terminase large subunit GpA-like protein